MLKLDKRPAKLGVNLNTRREKHGDEPVPAKDIRVKDILLSTDEVCEFFRDKHVWDMLFTERKGKPAEPFWTGKLGALPAPGKWKESNATISFGLKPYSVMFVDAKISRVSFEPQTGGLTAMVVTLSCLKSNISGDLALLDDYLDQTVDITLEFGEEASEDEDAEEQDELDLAPVGVPVDKPKRGRKPTGAALN